MREALTKEESEQLGPGDKVVLRDIPYDRRDGLTVGEKYEVLDTYDTRASGKGVVIADDNNHIQELHSGFFASLMSSE